MKGIVKKTTLAAAAAAGLALGGNAWAAGSTGSTSTGGGATTGGTSTNGPGAPGDTGPAITQEGREGTVTGVDPSKGVISLNTKDMDIRVNQGTVFYRNGQPASLNDIQPGDDVRASYINGSPVHAYKVEASTPRASNSMGQ